MLLLCDSSPSHARARPPLLQEAPRPLHGEAGVAEWAPVPADPDLVADATTVTFEASLPLAGLRVRRAFRLSGPSVIVTTTALRPTDAPAAPVEWAEHTTIGGPFLDGVATVDASVDGVWEMPCAGATPAEADAPCSVTVAEALRVPRTDDAPTGSVRTARVAVAAAGDGHGRWSAACPPLGWSLSAEWAAADFPWLCLWTEHRSRSHAPWSGRERTRGLELSTKPFPEGRPPPSRAAVFEGAPAAFSVEPGAPAVSKAVTLTWRRLPPVSPATA